VIFFDIMVTLILLLVTLIIDKAIIIK